MSSKISFLSEQDMQKLGRIGKCAPYKKGQTIVNEGSGGRKVFFIYSGSVNISLTRLYGGTLLRHVGVGEMFGEISYLDEGRPSAKVVANEAVETLEIEGTDLDGLLATDEELASRFYRTAATTLARRLRYESRNGW
jgi:CRP-like cAMP-binding protein